VDTRDDQNMSGWLDFCVHDESITDFPNSIIPNYPCSCEHLPSQPGLAAVLFCLVNAVFFRAFILITISRTYPNGIPTELSLTCHTIE
jgi:hypothetical protein